MSITLDDVILERISFLQDQLGGEDDPAFIRIFQAQIRTLKSAQLGSLGELTAARKADVESCTDPVEADRIFAELEALEWLQRQVARLVA